MKKITSVLLTVLTIIAVTGTAIAKTRYTYITPKAPVITPSLKPIIQKYKQENYTGAMIDLQELLKKEKTNTYAQYYLALCYTKLGYEAEAKATYASIIQQNSNEALIYYSLRALACIDDPRSIICVPPQVTVEKNEPQLREDDDDITKFIYSGKRIHPAAMDNIIKERMEVKLQQDEYKSKQNDQLGPLSYNAPTNEEIAYALDTLAKIGINPFSQNYNLSSDLGYNYMNGFSPYRSYGNNPDIEQMLLYSQLNQQNNFINYGI